MTTFTVGNQAQLESAIRKLNAGSHGTGAHTINISANFTLAGNIWAIALPANTSVTIDGQGHTIDGPSRSARARRGEAA